MDALIRVQRRPEIHRLVRMAVDTFVEEDAVRGEELGWPIGLSVVMRRNGASHPSLIANAALHALANIKAYRSANALVSVRWRPHRAPSEAIATE